MNHNTIVRIIVSSPRYGVFDKAMAVEGDSFLQEREFIEKAEHDLFGESNRWLETVFPTHGLSPIEEQIIEIQKVRNER